MRRLFGELVGNDGIRNIIARELLRGNAAHAYIIEGPVGSGKRTAARLVAAALLCADRDEGSSNAFPCGKCLPCEKVARGVSPDVKYIRSDKSTVGVDLIREIKEDLYIEPNDGEKKIYIIEDAETLTPQAQNALLLSLEEPPRYANFLLLTTDAKALLETVRSRAPVVRMQIFPTATVYEYLREKFPTSPDTDLKRAAGYSGGVIGRGIELLSGKGRAIENEDMIRQSALDLATAILSPDGRYYELILSLPKDREETVKLLMYTVYALRDILAVKRRSVGELLFFFSPDEAAAIAKQPSLSRIAVCLDTVMTAYENSLRYTSAALSLSGVKL